MDWKLELVIIPVSDVDAAKAFYSDRAGFNIDVDHRGGDDFRVVQCTPPGSACSVTFGVGIGSNMSPGSIKGIHLVVNDIEAACRELNARGVATEELHHFGAQGRTPGVHPTRDDYGTFSSFSDPDGNTWVIQEVPSRP